MLMWECLMRSQHFGIYVLIKSSQQHLQPLKSPKLFLKNCFSLVYHVKHQILKTQNTILCNGNIMCLMQITFVTAIQVKMRSWLYTTFKESIRKRGSNIVLINYLRLRVTTTEFTLTLIYTLYGQNLWTLDHHTHIWFVPKSWKHITV